MIAARNQPDEIPELLEMIAKPFPKDGWVAALAQGLKRAGTTIDKVDKEKKLASVFDQAGASATTASRDERKRALSLLGFATFQQAAPAALACLAKDQPQSIQTAAVGTLGQFKNAEVSQILLDHWANFGAETRAAALTELLSRPDRTLALLKSIQDSATTNEKGSAGFQPASGGILPPSEAKRSKQDASTHGQDARAPLSIRSARPLPTDLSPAQIQSLLKSDNKAIADLAKTALASVIPPSRESVLAKFQPALATKGDMAKGQLVFLQRCIACHRAAGQGIQVGPDFVTVKTKGKEALMTAILDPHKEVAPQFIAYTVNTKDGQTLAGIVTKDDASSMTIKIMGGAEINLPRSNIKGSTSSGQSLMPEGIEAGMTVQDMADLLEFIEKAN
jgi:putative heme-binding domain-containing protein